MTAIIITLIICVTVAILYLSTLIVVNKPKIIAANAEKQRLIAKQKREDDELISARFERMALLEGASEETKAELARASSMTQEIELNQSAKALSEARRAEHAAEADKNRSRRY